MTQRDYDASCHYKMNSNDFYEAYIHRDQADWDKLYASYDTAVDWPAVTFYKKLIANYPYAKVLLTMRSAGNWYKLAKNTVRGAATTDLKAPEGLRMASFTRLVTTVALDGRFADKKAFTDEERVKKI